MSDVFIARQPILDRDMEIFAYELLFNQGLNPGKDAVLATEDLIKKTEEEIGFSAIIGKNTAMMQLPKALIKDGTLPALAEDQTLVLEIPNDVMRDVEVLRNLKSLKANGSSIALDNYIDDDSSVRLASISDYVKIDTDELTELKMKVAIEKLHEKGIKVVAQRVETEESFNYLKNLGFDLFQGYFFTNPVIINGEKLSGNKLTLLQLMAKINDADTDFHELSEIISKDVALSHKLLLAVNNPAAMIPVQVESIGDALKYMGIKRLKFWVNMLMLSGMDDAPKELLVSSLIRAKFCELLAEKSGHVHDKDTYFLVGLFSSLGAFFKVPIDDIMAEMPMTDEIKNALIERSGSLGETVKCVIALETGSANITALNYEGLGIAQIGNLYLSATAWAQQVIAGE